MVSLKIKFGRQAAEQPDQSLPMPTVKQKIKDLRLLSIWNNDFALLFFTPCEAVLFQSHFDIEVPHTPLQGLLVRVVEYIKPVSENNPTPVENFYDLAVVVTRDNHCRSECVFSVSSYKEVSVAYFAATGCYAI